MNLEEFYPKPHPTKVVFKKHGIPTSAVANYLQLTTTYVNSMLSGHLRITPENEEKLNKLAEYVEQKEVSCGQRGIEGKDQVRA